ncbi:hypothetical protein VCSRO128_3001 [Vibrio cholerae]|nr:hypothetical protein VCSRO128_3001 [Vibrio cholerae]
MDSWLNAVDILLMHRLISAVAKQKAEHKLRFLLRSEIRD